MNEIRKEFERLHLGNNAQLARRNTTDGLYVLPSVNDAWSGFITGYAAGVERAAGVCDRQAFARPVQLAEAIRAAKDS